MALQVVCPHCGHPNGVGKVFCGSCGGNMQASGKPPKIISDSPTGSMPKRLVVGLLKLAAILAPVALLVGILMPMASTAKAPRTRGPASEYDSALRRVHAAIKSGAPAFVQIFTEDQINAKLAVEIAKANSGTTPGVGFMVKAITVDLIPRGENSPDRARVHMLTENKFKLKITYAALVDLNSGPDGLTLSIAEAHLGQVPAVAGLQNALVGARLRAVLGSREEESDILAATRQVQIKENQIALQIVPAAAAAQP